MRKFDLKYKLNYAISPLKQQKINKWEHQKYKPVTKYEHSCAIK